MLNRAFRRGSWHTLALTLLAVHGGACSEDVAPIFDASRHESSDDSGESQRAEDTGDAGADAAQCPWGVDPILEAIEEAPFSGRSCGSFSNTGGVKAGFACFDEARTQGQAALLTINKCSDCSNQYTYIATDEGALFELQLEDDAFGGDPLRTAVVRRCGAITFDGSGFSGAAETSYLSVAGDVRCAEPSELYRCSEDRTQGNRLPSYPVMEPRKITDLASGDQPSTILHLYVSNQSFDDPLVNVRVTIDNWQVVQGDFDVKTQHNWFKFDIRVPIGTRELFAFTFKPDHAVSISQRIEVPGERWAVLDYWRGKSEEERFTLHVFDQPVVFQ